MKKKEKNKNMMLYYLLLFLLSPYLALQDAPKAWEMRFQDPAIPQGFIHLHNDICFFLFVILALVFLICIFIKAIKKSQSMALSCILIIFFFLLSCHLVWMIPYSFPATSNLMVTFGLFISLIIVIAIVGFQKHGLHFFSLLLPKGTASILADLFRVILSIIFIHLLDWWTVEIFMMDVDSSKKNPDEKNPDEDNPDHDMPDVVDNPPAPHGDNNPQAPHGENNSPDRENPLPGPNIQPTGPEQRPEAVQPEIENPHGHPQGNPEIDHPEPAQGNQEPAQGNQEPAQGNQEDRREPLERSGKKRKLSQAESQTATATDWGSRLRSSRWRR